MLQFEMDELRTECEKYREELKSKTKSIQEKDAENNELKKTIEEKVRCMEIDRNGNHSHANRKERVFTNKLKNSYLKYIIASFMH